MKKIPELLVPAGGMEQLKAAVACGADAVYLGGPSFSARARADNFTEDELKRAIEYAHINGVRVHVALNTLLTDRELSDALDFTAKVYGYGADAVIVQDTGLFSMIHRYLPNLPLHLSTQGTVTDAAGVYAAAERGAQRVILARELSFDEITEICRTKGNTEIEIFVHGAICIGLSGQCHMSGMIGNRSGNRGDCAQPCRMKYSLEKQGTGKASEGYQLSPRDLCLLLRLDRIIEAGVDSVKIEGRMKSPEYVAAVTGIYRKHLDLLGNGETDESVQCAPDDLRILRQLYSRGDFTDSYFEGNAYEDMMSGSSPKHQGIPAGKMRIFYPKNGHAEVQLTERLSVGDGVEIRGQKGAADNVVTYLRDRKGRMLRNAEAGESVELGDLRLKGNVPEKGAEVYKLTDRELLQRIRQGYSRPVQRLPVRFRLKALTGERMVLEGETEVHGVLFNERVIGREVLEPAHSAALERDSLRARLLKTGGTPYSCEEIKLNIEGNPFIRVSALNDLRRQVLTALTEQRISLTKPSRKEYVEALQRCRNAVPEEFKKNCSVVDPPKDMNSKLSSVDVGQKDVYCQLYFFNTSDLKQRIYECLRRLNTLKVQMKQMILCFPLELFFDIQLDTELMNAVKSSGCTVDVVFPVEMRRTGRTAREVEEMLRKLKMWEPFRAAMIADQGQLQLIRLAEVPFETDRQMNILNSFSASYWLSEGALSVCLSEEPRAIHFFDSDSSFEGCSVEMYGRLPVMYLEHCPVGSHGSEWWHHPVSGEKIPCCSQKKKYYYCRKGNWILRDRTGAGFPVEADSRFCRAVVYSHRLIDHTGETDRLLKRGFRMFRVNLYEGLSDTICKWLEAFFSEKNAQQNG